MLDLSGNWLFFELNYSLVEESTRRRKRGVWLDKGISVHIYSSSMELSLNFQITFFLRYHFDLRVFEAFNRIGRISRIFAHTWFPWKWGTHQFIYSLFRQSRIQSYVRRWIVEVVNPLLFLLFLLQILDIVGWDLFREEKEKGRGKWNSRSFLISESKSRRIFDKWLARFRHLAPAGFVGHLDEIYAGRNSEASNTCPRHFAPACSLPCFKRGTP